MAGVDSSSMGAFIQTGGRFPVLMVTANRPAMLDKTLASLKAVRCVQVDDVFVVQDGDVAAVKEVLERHGVRYHQKTADVGLRGGRPPDGAERIAQHYRYALQYAFSAFPSAPAIIVAEDDFLFSPDYYEYFHAVAPALESDPTLWLASAWHDNGFDYLVADPYALRRTRYFPGLGWLLPRRIWEDELARSWPESHWDHWMRDPARHRGRDIIVPEIPRDYHAGLKGTFMDTPTHNRYFGSIAMHSDTAFTWDTPDGADAIKAILQPGYGARLEAVLTNAATKHLGSVEEINSFATGTGVVWYHAAPNTPNHDDMRLVAQYFGIWHEGGRGSRDGVHELWWLGDAKLYLINVCDRPSTLVPVSGSIECSSYGSLKPKGVRVLAAHQFAGASHPRLPLHKDLFAAKWVSPLAHVSGEADLNGPVDIAKSEQDQQLAAAVKPRLVRPHGHNGGEEAEQHEHTRFMGDLALPPAALRPPIAGGNGAGPLALPKTVKLAASAERGSSCTQVCARAYPGSRCVAAYLPTINTCATLRANFPCAECADSMGRDQPAMIDLTAPRDKLPGYCLVNTDSSLFSCEGQWEYARRLCPCDTA